VSNSSPPAGVSNSLATAVMWNRSPPSTAWWYRLVTDDLYWAAWAVPMNVASTFSSRGSIAPASGNDLPARMTYTSAGFWAAAGTPRSRAAADSA
jgi:hypothetical protein